MPKLINTPILARAVLLAGAYVMVPANCPAGSIFDDDYVPPTRPQAPRDDAQPAVKPVAPAPAAAPAPDSAAPPTAKPLTDPTPAPASDGNHSSRLPVPAAAEQAKSRKLLKEIFAADLAKRTATARRELAEKFLDQSAKMDNASCDKFVLLNGANEAAIEAGDFALCVRVADALTSEYDVDPIQYKRDTALKISFRAGSPETTAANIHDGLNVVDDLIATEDYPAASKLLQTLRLAATGTPLFADVQSRSLRVERLQAEYAKIAPSILQLKAAPNDPAANLAVGEYLCFTKGDWKGGLALLAKGGATDFSAAATLDLGDATDSKKQIDIGDAWWACGEKETGATQFALR